VNKFNLTFWGEILPGKDPQQVKLRFAKLFGIDDPERRAEIGEDKITVFRG
jgi:hypothetical protein